MNSAEKFIRAELLPELGSNIAALITSSKILPEDRRIATALMDLRYFIESHKIEWSSNTPDEKAVGLRETSDSGTQFEKIEPLPILSPNVRMDTRAIVSAVNELIERENKRSGE